MEKNKNEQNQYEEKKTEVKSIHKSDAKTGQVSKNDPKFWYQVDVFGKKAVMMLQLIKSTQKMFPFYRKQSTLKWRTITDMDFKVSNRKTTFILLKLIKLLEQVEPRDPEQKTFLTTCLECLASFRLTWEIKFKVLDYEPDGIIVKVYYLMVMRMRVRVLKLKLSDPVEEDPILSCMKILDQILSHVLLLCHELQEMVTSDPRFNPEIDWNEDSDGAYKSDDEGLSVCK